MSTPNASPKGATPRDGRPNRLFLYGPIAIGLVLLAAWWGVWRVGTQEILKTADAIIADQAELGVTLSYETFSSRGFPFIWRGAFHGFRAETDGLSYSADEVFVDALPYDLNRVIFSTRAPQTITIEDETLTLVSEDGRASLERDAATGWLAKVSSRSSTIKLEDQSTGLAMGPFLLNVKPAVPDGRTMTPDAPFEALAASLTAAEIDLAHDKKKARIDKVEASFTLEDLTAPDGPRLDIAGAAAAIGEARVYASGALNVDSKGYLAGQLRARITKPAALAAFLKDAGVFSEAEADAFAGGAALAAFAGGGELSAPILFENGAITSMGVRLGDAPRLVR